MIQALPFLLATQLLSPPAVGAVPATPAAGWVSEGEATTANDSDTTGSSSDISSALRPSRRIPSPEVLEERGTVVRRIFVRSGDIFDMEDPEEDNRVFRLANRLHLKTRDRVIERLLLVARGERFSTYRVEESERILRSQRYLYDAEIVPVAYDGRSVDLEVRTRDVWTLRVGVSFERSGGETETDTVIQDSNFLGSGKEVTLKYSSNVDRTGFQVRYIDPNVSGSRAKLELNFADNDDGEFRMVKLIRPFYSLESRWAAGLKVASDDRLDTLYDLGEVASEFRHEEMVAEAWIGRSAGLVQNQSRRWLFGFTFQEDRFSTAQEGPPAPPAGGGLGLGLQNPFTPKPKPDVLFAEDIFPDRSLEDRILTYPWVGFELAQNRYRETHDLNSLHRTEDLALGHHLSGRLGWSTKGLGANRDRGIFSGVYTFGTSHDDERLFFLDGVVSGRFGTDGVENLLAGVSGRFYWRNIGDHAFYATASFQMAENLDAENQLLLGGDTGLRGYPLRYQEGERRALVTLEQRFYTDWHPFRLAYVGAAVFADVGQAWTPGIDRPSDRGILTDVGLGLRISPSRSGFGSMIHLDVAFPLDAPGDISSAQWLVSTKETF